MKAYISAGGKGTRLKSLTGNVIPKPMAEIAGIPVIERAIINLKKHGVTDITISVGYLSEIIKNHLKDGSELGVKIDYITEEFPLGSGGALYYLKGKYDEDFILCSGDTVFDVDVKRMLSYHKRKNAAITMLTHPNAHPYDSDVITADRFGRVLGIDKKGNVRNYYYTTNVTAGFFIVNPHALDFLSSPKKINLEHDLIGSLVSQGERGYA